MLKFEPSPLQLPLVHSGSSPGLPFTFQEIFKRAFKIYSTRPQANKYVTNTLLQCSPASVGLAQARPKLPHYLFTTKLFGNGGVCCAWLRETWLTKLHH